MLSGPLTAHPAAGQAVRLETRPVPGQPDIEAPDSGKACLVYHVRIFAVTELTYAAGDTVFVAALTAAGPNGGLELSPHPDIQSLVVFPGTQEQCVEAFRHQAKCNRLGAFILLGFGLLEGLIHPFIG